MTEESGSIKERSEIFLDLDIRNFDPACFSSILENIIKIAPEFSSTLVFHFDGSTRIFNRNPAYSNKWSGDRTNDLFEAIRNADPKALIKLEYKSKQTYMNQKWYNDLENTSERMAEVLNRLPWQ